MTLIINVNVPLESLELVTFIIYASHPSCANLITAHIKPYYI